MDETPTQDESSSTMVTIEHMFEIWVEPELERRGLMPSDLRVRKAMVVLHRDQSPVVKINDEVELVATVRATRPIAAGEEIRAADFDEVHAVEPVGVDEDAGWIAFFAVPDGRLYLAFDFRYERGRSAGVMSLADEFVASASDDLSAQRLRPAIDHALAAAELAVMVQMRTHAMPENPRNRHGSRYAWFDGWAELGNAQRAHAKAIRRLEQLRGWARYADDRQAGPRDGEVERLLRDVEALVEQTRARIAPQRNDL